MGFETSDDAGVYKLDENRYIVQTVDFITPVCDDPYTFGRISAVNSLSDIYAMGADPLTALTVLMYNCDIDDEIISAMMQGACDELAKANCSLLGGHTVNDSEVKLGFSITGTIIDGKIFKNVGLRKGDLIVQTKPLGVGILATAVKGELATDEDISNANKVMLMSNCNASKLLRKYDISACTDVTGFGLGGHLLEMSKGSDVTININIPSVKLIDKVLTYANMGIIPGGAYFNKQFCLYNYRYISNEKEKEIVMFDPQTSGGLLIGVSEKDADNLLKNLVEIGYEDASIIGYVSAYQDINLIFQ